MITFQSSEIKRKLRNLPRVVTNRFHRVVLQPLFHHIIVNEYPRSGGTWISKLISGSSGIPKIQPFDFGKRVIHEHRIDTSNTKQVYVVRDCRDVMISNYFHCFYVNEMNNAGRVIQMKKVFSFEDYDNVSGNLKTFITRMLTAPFAPPILFQDFVDSALANPNGLIVKYEDMKAKPHETLRRVLDFYNLEISEQRIADTIALHDISNYATGKRNRHVRKGVIGDWKNYFNRDSAAELDRLAGNYLIKLSYEKDNNWVDSVE